MPNLALLFVTLALLQWLLFWARMMRRPGRSSSETAFLLSTLAVAIVWVCAGPQWNRGGIATAGTSAITRGCAAARQGMPSAELQKAMGDPARRVTEVDTRGPGAEAWVYDDARCIAHVLNEHVRSVDYE
jgi:hypothetical protein